MLKIPFYTKRDCPSCEEAYALLMLLQSYYAFEIIECDIYTNDTWLEEYQLIIPVIQVNDVFLNSTQMDLTTIEGVLKEALGEG